MPRPRHHLALWVTTALALTAAGCGGSSPGPSAGTGRSSGAPAASETASASATSSRDRRRPRPRGAPVGATLRAHAGGSTLDVTATKVLDPLTGAGAGAGLLAGMRAVGVEVAIRNLAGATYDSTASGDWSVRTTAGLASPLFVRHGACQTPLTDFESLIGVGETRAGCVAFSVPRRARVLSVRFSPHSRAPGTVAWR